MKKYTCLFFDLDHTLWDFDLNSKEAIEDLIKIYAIDELDGFDFNDIIHSFNKANHLYWNQYNTKQISVNELRIKRFDAMFDTIKDKQTLLKIRELFNEQYIEICSKKGHLMNNAFDVLDYLYGKYYRMYILTNGFDHIQYTKLITSNIFHYFEEVITPADCDARKPDLAYFDYSLMMANATVNECIMIGDSENTDVKGAVNSGIDTVFFNPNGLKSNIATYSIQDLIELKNIL